MTLSFLKAEGYFAVWVDQESVRVGVTLEEVFGRLSSLLEDTVRTKERVIAAFEVSFNGREYRPPTIAEVKCARARLACFHIELADPVARDEALK